MNIFRKISNFFTRRNNSQCSLSSNDIGIRYFRDSIEESSFEWKECIKIVTYKDDLITTDLICLEFELNNGKVFLAHEEQSGFEHLIGILSKIFPSIDENWYAEVMQPAFETNFKVLYER